MKALRLAAVMAAICATLELGPAWADGGQPGGGLIVSPPPPAAQPGRFSPFNGGFFFYERDYVPVVVQEVVRDEKPAQPPVAATPPPPPRKPYVIGRTYSSLPSGCLKLIEEGVSYFQCSGQWYRELKGPGDTMYRAVARP
ncbi:MAG: hypothetical protein ACJ8EP_04190 [Sphingomicrobium sp.]